MNSLKKLMQLILVDVLKKTDNNGNIKDIDDKILDITNLATTDALTAVENKIFDFSDFVKKADYVAKKIRN